jgi:class 3 adenylate cyclase/Flp pilus assembly protein TadD
MDPAATAPQYSLAAIVFTDIVGFSRLMSENERETLPRAKAELARLREICERHNGRVLKSTGDGLLMHFTSAVQAVACALEIQKPAFTAEGQDPLRHRIGIHLGDVSLEDGDVMGDGVNIAARLQTQADPGGICISKTVYDVVKNRLAIQATFLGPRELKNISEAVPIYKILIEAQAGGAVRSVRSGRRSSWVLPLAGLLIFLLMILAVGFGVHLGFHLRKARPTAASRAAAPSAAPSTTPAAKPLSDEAKRYVGAWLSPQRRTIMILLPDGRYGLDLALGDHRVLGLVGTWQADANTITTTRTDPPQTNVLHLLSVTDSQLIAQTELGYRYMERVPMPNLPTITVSGISSATIKDTTHPQIARSPDTFPAAESYNLGVAAFNAGDYEQAASRFTEALALNPNYEAALSRRAEAYDLDNVFDKALADYNQLIQQHPGNAGALGSRAGLDIKLGKYQDAIDDANKALALKPGLSYVLNLRGRAYLLLGQYQQAITDLDACLALTPTNVYALIDRGVAKKASGDLAGGQADLDQARELQTAPPVKPAVAPAAPTTTP